MHIDHSSSNADLDLALGQVIFKNLPSMVILHITSLKHHSNCRNERNRTVPRTRLQLNQVRSQSQQCISRTFHSLTCRDLNIDLSRKMTDMISTMFLMGYPISNSFRVFSVIPRTSGVRRTKLTKTELSLQERRVYRNRDVILSRLSRTSKVFYKC